MCWTCDNHFDTWRVEGLTRLPVSLHKYPIFDNVRHDVWQRMQPIAMNATPGFTNFHFGLPVGDFRMSIPASLQRNIQGHHVRLLIHRFEARGNFEAILK
jgi:hypothetical protein